MNKADCATFIAGSPRSGTTLMTALLDGHPDLLVFPEEYLYAQPCRMPGEGTEDIVNAVFKEKVLLRLQGKANFLDELHDESRNYDAFDYRCFEDSVNERFRKLVRQKPATAEKSFAALALLGFDGWFRTYCRQRAVDPLGSKTPQLRAVVEPAFFRFSAAKMIYMIRDPREVILSRTIKRSKKRHLKKGGEHRIVERREDCPPAVGSLLLMNGSGRFIPFSY